MALLIVIIILLVLYLILGFRIVAQYQGGVVLRLGKFKREVEPGLRLLIPFVDTLQKVDKRVVARKIEKQDVITKDSVPMTLDAIVYYKVVSTKKALLEVDRYKDVTADIAQTVLRSSMGSHTLNDILTNQQVIDEELRKELDKHTEDWGIQITSVQIRSMDLPDGMKRAMAKEAEAERERKAKVIAAQGELEASEKLTEAAKKINEVPSAMMLRQLQTMTEIGTEQNTLILFPYELTNMLTNLTKK